MEEIVKHLGLPERTLYAVCDAAMGLRVRNSTYRNLAELNDIMASRDLKNAVDAGLLIPSGERRGRLYIGAPNIRAVFDRLRKDYIRPIPVSALAIVPSELRGSPFLTRLYTSLQPLLHALCFTLGAGPIKWQVFLFPQSTLH